MHFEIRKSKTINIIGITVCIIGLAFCISNLFSDITFTGKQEYWYIPVCLFTLTACCLIKDYRDQAALYIFNHEGLSTSDQKAIFSWQEVKSYKIEYITQRHVLLKVLYLYGLNKKPVKTFVLTGTDCCEQKLKEFLNKMVNN